MIAEGRRERILELLRRDGAVVVSELARELGAAEVTVRRDITLLATQGLVHKVHGGATLPRHDGGGMIAGDQRFRSIGVSQFWIGLVVPSMEFYWPQIVNGAQAATAAHRGRITVRASAYDAGEDRRQITRVLESGVQGLLLAPSTAGRAGGDLMRWIAGLRVPTVLVERTSPFDLASLAIDSISTDHPRGAGLVMRYLVGQGHRRLGLYTSDGSPTTPAIRAGWQRTADDLDLDLSDQPVASGPPFGRPGWREALSAFVTAARAAGTTAVLVHSDPEALALLQIAEELGMAVPGDLSLVAYDDEVASVSTPAITAARPPKHYLGRHAVELLLARIREGADRPIHQIKLLPDLAVRDSVRPRNLESQPYESD